MTTKLFTELGLSAEVLKAIDKLGFEQAAPIQAEAIPVLMAGHDVVGQSQTGSGKTAAFAIPAIEKTDPLKRVVQALILCPTRELAVQVSEEVHKLALFKRGITALPVYGGQSYERQFWGLKQGAQIVIGTPGRIMDHMRRGTLRLDAVKMVILDEADVMLDMGFRDDIEFILQGVPAERQTVFFSATMPRPIQDLIQKYARNPQQVRIQQNAVSVPTVEQVYYEVDRRFKVELLTRLIDIHDLKLGIVFCNTKRMVDDLVDHLNAQGYSADRLHGDMTQMMRDRVMNKFRKSGLEFLVATDVAARGIDVDDVQVVFNYDLPYDPEDYVHRIGRTGRAGRSGMAISFVAGREVFQIRHIERYMNARIHPAKVPTLDEVEEARANVFLDRLRVTLRGGEFQRRDHLIERLLEEGFSSTDIASALIHLLQGGEAAPAAKTPSEATRPRPEREPVQGARDQRKNPWPEREPRRHVERAVVGKPSTLRPPAPPRPPAPAVVSVKPAPKPAAPIAAAPAPLPAVAPVPPTSPRPPVATVAPEKPSAPAPPLAAVPSGAIAIAEAPAPSPRPVAAPIAPKPARESAARPIAAPTGGGRVTPKPGRPSKSTAPTPADKTCLHMNLGAEMGVVPIDIVNAIAGETGLPGKVVGTVDIRERHLFVDVASEHVNAIIAKLNRAQIKGRRVKVKVA